MILRQAFRTLILLSIVAPIAHADDRRYPFEKKVLDNGLTVISLEDHSCPIVAVQVWYHVGSKDEDPQRQGFAHMFEHMMFRGTDRLGPEDHFTYVRQTGGSCNAYTSFDNTTYINELPSNQLALALWLEAERMAFLTIDDESFYKERAVVEEERRLRSLNTPYGTVPEKLLPVIFEKHPYQWTPIGQIPHLRAATIDELQAFWDKYYVPNNATLIVVGDTTHARVQELAEQYFGWIPRSPDPPLMTIVEPPQTAQRKITIPEKKGPVPIVFGTRIACSPGVGDEGRFEVGSAVILGCGRVFVKNPRTRGGRLGVNVPERLAQGLQFFDVAAQLLLACQSAHIMAEHFIGTKRGLAIRPQRNQHAGDDRDVHLYLDPVGTVAEQMSAPQDVLEEPKEGLDGPAVLVDQCNDFRLDIHNIGGDQNRFPLFRATPAGLVRFAAGLAGDLHQSEGHIETSLLGLAAGEANDPVPSHFPRLAPAEYRPIFERVEHTVVAHSAHERGLRVDNIHEQLKLGVPTIHHINPARPQV